MQKQKITAWYRCRPSRSLIINIGCWKSVTSDRSSLRCMFQISDLKSSCIANSSSQPWWVKQGEQEVSAFHFILLFFFSFSSLFIHLSSQVNCVHGAVPEKNFNMTRRDSWACGGRLPGNDSCYNRAPLCHLVEGRLAQHPAAEIAYKFIHVLQTVIIPPLTSPPPLPHPLPCHLTMETEDGRHGGE